MKNQNKNLLSMIAITVVIMIMFTMMNKGNASSSAEISFSQLLSYSKSGQVSEVKIDGNNITGTLSSGEKFKTYGVTQDMVKELSESGADVRFIAPDSGSYYFAYFLQHFAPLLLLIGFFLFMARGSSGAKAFGLGKSKAN